LLFTSKQINTKYCTNPKTLLTDAVRYRDGKESKVDKVVSEIIEVPRLSIARIFVQTQLQRNISVQELKIITTTLSGNSSYSYNITTINARVHWEQFMTVAM